MQISFPSPANGYSTGVLAQIFDTLRRRLLGVVTFDEAAPYVHIFSDDGSVWKITVSNDGVISATKVGVS